MTPLFTTAEKVREEKNSRPARRTVIIFAFSERAQKCYINRKQGTS
jgi:hypothetical protein